MKNILLALSIGLITTSLSFAQELVKFQGSKGKYGFYDSSKKMGQLKPTIKAQFDDAQEFNKSTGLAAVKSEGKWGMIDKTGSPVIPFQYDNIGERTSGEHIKVHQAGKIGLIDNTGKLVLPVEYDYISEYPSEGLTPVRQGKKYGFFAATTSEVTPLQYDKVLVTIKGWFVQKNGKWALVSTELKELTPFKYDKMEQYTPDYHYAEADGKTYKISLTGAEDLWGTKASESTVSTSSSSSKTNNKKADPAPKTEKPMKTYTCKFCNKTVQSNTGYPGVNGCIKRSGTQAHGWQIK